MGKKQPLIKAVDMVELKEEAEGLMAAVQARRARRVLPKLSPEGVVEYVLIIPKQGQRNLAQTGADLDWVLNDGRISSARSTRTEPDCDRLHGYSSLGSPADDMPFQRRIVSAGKSKNKLPWEVFTVSSIESDPQCNTPDGKAAEHVTNEDLSFSRKLSPENYIPSFSSAEPPKMHLSRRNESPARLKRSGSLNIDKDLFKTANLSEIDSTKESVLSRNPSVERTFSLPAKSSSTGSFLLPSYPLASLPGSVPTPTLARRQVNSPVSMSNTWPDKRDSSPHQRDASPWRDLSGTTKDVLETRCSPRLFRSSLVTSTSSFRKALSNTRINHSVSPVISPEHDEQLEMRNVIRNNGQNLEEGDNLDMQEMLNSLRSLRNSAAKKRVKVALSNSDLDPDSPDSAVRLDLGLDSPSHTPSILTSSTSESGLSSLSSVINCSLNGIKTSPRNFVGVKSRFASVPSAKPTSSVSMDFNNPQGLSQRNEWSSDVGVVGHSLYTNGRIKNDENREVSPQTVKPSPRDSVRLLGAKGSQCQSSKDSSGMEMLEGVIGRGMFGSSSMSFEQGNSVTKCPSNLYSTINSFQADIGDGLSLDEVKDNARTVRLSRDKMRQQHTNAADESSHGDQTRDRIRHRVKQMLSESPTTECTPIINKDLQLNGNTLHSCKGNVFPNESLNCSRSPVSSPEAPTPFKSFTPHQPSPPAAPPNPKNVSRLRRAPSLGRTRPSQSHSSDELTSVSLSHKKNFSEAADLCPFSKPELAMTHSFNLLSSDDWEKKIEGLTFLRSLANFHSDILQSKLHDVCLLLSQEVKNLRSGVSRTAVCTLGDLFSNLQKAMDQELEASVKALLHKAGECNAFIRQDVDAALDSMVQHCTPTRSIQALLTGGLGHLNAVVRKCTAQHLADLVDKVGAARLLSGGKELTDKLLPAISKLSQDSSQEARYYGRRMLLALSSHSNFDKILEKYIPAKDLPAVRDTVLSLKTKGLGSMPLDSQSARGRRSLPGSGTVRASSLNREPLSQSTRESNNLFNSRSSQTIADKTEYVNHMSSLLGSKDFRERIKGIDQLVADCHNNPNIVISSIFPIFDAFRSRLQESNSKVNLHALESLQKIIPLLKDNLSQLVNILVPAIVDNHLNSKNNAVYTAAIGAINSLTSNLDNILLLQPFCTKAQFLSGKAKVDLIEKVAEMVTELYPRKPNMVEQKVLPLLWHLLGTSTHSGTIHGRGGSVRGATVSLCEALYAHMGQGLSESAASQPANVHKSFNEVLRSLT
uniref:TOG domain-containing protein n=1 Tax=Knipowitschia caucasica TaxID=637954 RepID=A0AAV2JIG7_KNICA